MSDPYIGEIRMIGFNYAPSGWQLCNGQLLPISQYTALFALLGTTYGGNGTTNFQLPNLQGRIPLHAGSGSGLPPYTLGQVGGAANLTLNSAQMPAHTHMVATPVSNAAATAGSPVNAVPAVTAVTVPHSAAFTPTVNNFAAAAVAGQTEAAFPTGPAGSNQPISTQPPYLAVNFIIAIEGIFPPRP